MPSVANGERIGLTYFSNRPNQVVGDPLEEDCSAVGLPELVEVPEGVVEACGPASFLS